LGPVACILVSRAGCAHALERLGVRGLCFLFHRAIPPKDSASVELVSPPLLHRRLTRVSVNNICCGDGAVFESCHLRMGERFFFFFALSVHEARATQRAQPQKTIVSSITLSDQASPIDTPTTWLRCSSKQAPVFCISFASPLKRPTAWPR
jgi:hypothetical protein